MTDWSPLGGDPAPGDPGYLTALAADMGGMADDIVQQSSGFTALAGNIHTVWRGGTDSAAFEASVREPAPMFRALHDDLVSARSALGTYAAVLDTEQPAAAAALARAANALRRIDGAKAQLASTPAPGPFASIFQSASGSAGPVYGPRRRACSGREAFVSNSPVPRRTWRRRGRARSRCGARFSARRPARPLR